jgi:dihydrolipoamide dehydrogenase
MPQFDVVVFGGGTAGVHVATEVARAGRTVAVVEAGLVGGECPNLACMPSKSLLQSAQRGETWEHAVARRDEVTGHLDDTAAAARLARAGVTLIRGTATVSEPGVVEVTPIAAAPEQVHDIRAGNLPDTAIASLGYTDLVIATGSEPVAPPIEGLTDVPAWTSAEALTGPDLPRRLIVLGGGPVGCELAQIYAAFGSQVTLIEAEDHVLPGEAKFAGELLADALRRTGADVRLGSNAAKAETTDTGLALTLTDGSRIEADRVLLATGRRPRHAGLGLDKLGVEIEPGTALPVDASCRVRPTAAGPGRANKPIPVWAAGDVTGVAAYTHTASYQARIVAANILGDQREADYRAIPRVVYTTPSVFAVGLSPAQATASGIELDTAGFDLAETARATVQDDDRGRVELYAGADDVLVGAAAVGLNAEEWMSEVTLAVRAAVPLATLADVVHAFPTYGSAIEQPIRDLAARKLRED